MITIENNVGRLIELRQTGHITMAELQVNGAKFGKVLEGIRGQIVMCTDWRGMQLLAPEVADVLLGIMKADNDRVERQAVLVDPSVILGLQLDRLFRDAGGKTRMTFRDAAVQADWLGSVLTPAERVQVKAFLASYKPTYP